MSKVIILGAGAAPGVPSLSCGWGACDPDNPKNIRTRTGTYIEIGSAKILIDTPPDIRQQMLNNRIKDIDAVLYTHSHADHLHGIDDLREITRIRLDKMLRSNGCTDHLHGIYNQDNIINSRELSINCYASAPTVAVIKKRFSYLIASRLKKQNIFFVPSLICNTVKANHPFYVKDVKITPLKLLGHTVPSTGYAFNDGEVVLIADFKTLASSVFKQIKVRPRLLIIPLTTPFGQPAHAGFDAVMEYIKIINPEHAVINHMATECDYNTINLQTPDFVEPAYDGLTITLDEYKEK